MVKLIKSGAYYIEGKIVKEAHAFMTSDKKAKAEKETVTYSILKAHGAGEGDMLKLKFDELTSHDVSYVSIVQTAKASGLESFPVPYTLTNCHNSPSAAGGTADEDDHAFGLSAAKKYGGNYVPAHLAAIHQYMRECCAKCGSMILGSDFHTRYGALGTLAVGEGGGEIVKQLLGRTYDIPRPETVVVYLKGKLRKGVGPHDVALSLIGAAHKSGFLKNKILEFIGPGLANLSMDYRLGIDVMTAQTGCLSSVWETDAKTREYLRAHGRENDYKELKAGQPAYYDGAAIIDLTRVEPMIALPFSPANVYTIKDFLSRPEELLHKAEEQGAKIRGGGVKLVDKIKDGKVIVDQAIIGGCAGGSYENIAEAAEILRGKRIGGAFSLSVYPASQPVYKCLAKGGYLSALSEGGLAVQSAFCDPCFGAGDTPQNNVFSVCHITSNAEMSGGQSCAAALMDARSIAATAANGGVLTSALDYEYNKRVKKYKFDAKIYEKRVYRGALHPDKTAELILGPNITDFPEQIALGKHLLMRIAGVLKDPVTTAEELLSADVISLYHSNPEKMAQFMLSAKDPEYVGRAKRVREEELARRESGKLPESVLKKLKGFVPEEGAVYGSAIVSNKQGEGCVGEQATCCQRVLGGVANISKEYADKRYLTNLINWGIVPFLCEKPDFKTDDYIYVADLAEYIAKGETRILAKVISRGRTRDVVLSLPAFTKEERAILLAGSLINYNKNRG